MTTARLVPVTVEMDGDELDAEDAWQLARHHGPWVIAKGAFLRFRFGDGFSSSRALALQGSLAVIPFLLALTGLAADIDQERPAEVVARTIEQVSPGHGTGDALARAVTGPKSSERAGEVALTLGLLLSLLSMTTAMGQVERGSNRIYGIRRDRRAVSKYGRAAALTAILALPLGLGFLLLVAGGSFADAMTETYDWPDGTRTAFQVARWPVGLVLLVFAIAVLFDHAPASPARPVVAGARCRGGGHAEHGRDGRAGGVRTRQRLVRQHLWPARRHRRAAAVVADDRHRVLLRRRDLCAARGASRRSAASRRGRPGRPHDTVV